MTPIAAIQVMDYEEMLVCAQTAASLALAVRMVTPPDAAAYAGPRYWLAMLEQTRDAFPEAVLELALDCGEDAGTALKAMAAGAPAVICTLEGPAQTALSAIAAHMGTQLLSDRGAPLQWPLPFTRAQKHVLCEEWLTAAKNHPITTLHSTEVQHAH